VVLGQDIAPSVPNVAQAYYIAYNGLPAVGGAYAELQQQQGVAASQMAKWRFNLTTNYDFDRGFLKGVNVGGGVRYTGSEILGYPRVAIPRFRLRTSPTYPRRKSSGVRPTSTFGLVITVRSPTRSYGTFRST